MPDWLLGHPRRARAHADDCDLRLHARAGRGGAIMVNVCLYLLHIAPTLHAVALAITGLAGFLAAVIFFEGDGSTDSSTAICYLIVIAVVAGVIAVMIPDKEGVEILTPACASK